MKVVVARGFKSAREQLYFEEEKEYGDEEVEEEEDEVEEAEAGAEESIRGRRQNWIRPAPRASGLRPQLDSVVFPPQMRSVEKK
jgi:hypothetical protein